MGSWKLWISQDARGRRRYLLDDDITQRKEGPVNTRSSKRKELEETELTLVGRHDMRVRRDPCDRVLVTGGVAAKALHQDPRVVQRLLAVIALQERDHFGCCVDRHEIFSQLTADFHICWLNRQGEGAERRTSPVTAVLEPAELDARNQCDCAGPKKKRNEQVASAADFHNDSQQYRGALYQGTHSLPPCARRRASSAQAGTTPEGA